jgi:hypothetical protein
MSALRMALRKGTRKRLVNGGTELGDCLLDAGGSDLENKYQQ